MRSESNKREKIINTANKKLEEMKQVQQDNEKILRLAETLKEENSLLMA